MILDAILAYLHFIVIFMLFAFLATQAILMRSSLEERSIRLLGRVDMLYGLSAVLVLVSGLLRLGLGAKGADFYMTTGSGRYSIPGRLSYFLGAQGPSVSVDTASRTDTGVYASIEAAVAPILVVSGGVRGDYVTTRNSGGHFGDRSTGNGAGSGYAAATFGNFGGVSLTGQIARGFRDPAISDRYYRGPTGRGFITGNPNLDPETSLQADLGVRYVAPGFRLAAFYYHYRINNLIERYSTATDFFFFRNRGTARVRGFEVEAQATLPGALTLDIATQVAEGRALDDHAYLDDVSPINLTAVLRRQFGERAFSQVRASYFSDDDHFGPTERAVNGYTMVDAAFGFRVARPFELRVQGRNLLDEEFFASQDVRTVLAPGRSVSLVANVKF